MSISIQTCSSEQYKSQSTQHSSLSDKTSGTLASDRRQPAPKAQVTDAWQSDSWHYHRQSGQRACSPQPVSPTPPLSISKEDCPLTTFHLSAEIYISAGPPSPYKKMWLSLSTKAERASASQSAPQPFTSLTHRQGRCQRHRSQVP